MCCGSLIMVIGIICLVAWLDSPSRKFPNVPLTIDLLMSKAKQFPVSELFVFMIVAT